MEITFDFSKPMTNRDVMEYQRITQGRSLDSVTIFQGWVERDMEGNVQYDEEGMPKRRNEPDYNALVPYLYLVAKKDPKHKHMPYSDFLERPSHELTEILAGFIAFQLDVIAKIKAAESEEEETRDESEDHVNR